MSQVMSNKPEKITPPQSKQPVPGEGLPWYRQFWPWFIIALPAAAVLASFYTLWLAISNPVQMVVDDEEYQRLNSGLKAGQTDKPEPPSG
jgi:hypothetical protein